MRLSLFSAALVAALVGYGSTIAVLLSAAAILGASPAQTTSWVLAICLAKAMGSASLSLWSRVPAVLAWSTPGLVLVATSEGVNLQQAVGAFIVAGLLIALTGLVKPLGRAVGLIPDGVAGAMLAGVLLPFCLRGTAALAAAPTLVLPMLGIFALVRLFNPALAVLSALGLGLGLAFGMGAAHWPMLELPLPQLTFIAPAFDLGVIIGLALPLYLVTMASQNLPGFATLRAAGYEPPVRRGLGVTGGLSAVAALFGASTLSMAAITAAICMGPDVHPDRNERWKVGLVYAGIWVLLGGLSPAILTLLAALPPQVMTALVALALLGPMTGALTTAYAQPGQRFAATMTLVVTGSGVALLGIGAAFWGLLAGIAIYASEHLAARWRRHP